MVAAQNEYVLYAAAIEVVELLSNSVRGALIPIPTSVTLFSGEHFDATARESIEAERAVDVTVQRRTVELGQYKNLAEAGVDRI